MQHSLARDNNQFITRTARIQMTKSAGYRDCIPIFMVNRSKELWGPDAHEFKPERCDDLPKAVFNIPGVWGHMLTFLGGPRACIAFRFAIAKMKALLFTLVRAFEFRPAVLTSQIGKKGTPLQHPILRGDLTNKVQPPLLVKRYQRGD
ncbi:hypothetical protein BDN67DRAFT_59798 [Paxillus ammoniavirescens]|nr:hypothetical protein BDN67DRAFT_59798 [Paxillus ammoniavirescens]